MTREMKTGLAPRTGEGSGQAQNIWESEYFNMLIRELDRIKSDDVDITYRKVRKNNGVFKNACTVRFHDAQIAPTVYLEPYYDHYLHGEAVSESAENILNYCRKKTPAVTFPENFFREYDTVRERLGIKLIGTRKNLEFLEGVPHIDYEDLSAVFFYLLEDPAFGNGMIIVRSPDMKRWGKTPEELLQDALESCPRMLPPLFRPLSEVLKAFHMEDDGGLFLLTNKSSLYGAAVLLYPEMLEEVAGFLGGSYFILPSSVHETILLPNRGEEAEDLLKIVEEINHTQVAEEEVLTDAVYGYEAGSSGFRKLV